MSVLNISDFSGGLNRRSPEKLDLSEASELSNLIHVEGSLRSFDGKTQYTATAMERTTDVDVRAVGRFISDGDAYTIGSRLDYVYIDTEESTYRWRPIVDTDGYYNHTYSAMSDRLYVGVSYGSYGGKIYRWDAFKYHTGTVTTSASSSTMTGTGTSWSSGGVRAGDAVILRIGTSWFSTVYRVLSVTNNTTIVLNANPPSATDTAYIITRFDECGVPAPSSTYTAAATAGTAGSFLETGTYQYVYTDNNTYTGVESNPISTPITVTTTSSLCKVHLSATATTATLYQANQRRFYRTLVGGSQYYFATAISRAGAGYTFATGITDDVADASLGDILETTGREMPPQGMRVFEWNNRLCGFSSSHDYTGAYAWTAVNGRNRFIFSTLNNPEYWPTNTLNPANILSYDSDSGGYITFGSFGVDIMSVVPEGVTSNKAGQSLLIFKQSGIAYRLRGYDWSDFEIEPAFQADCVSDNAININGYIFWVSRRGPMMLQPGTQTPVPIFEKIFPSISNPFSESINSETYYKSVRTCAWREYFIFAYAHSGTTYNNRIYAYHIPSSTWMQLGDSSNTIDASAFTTFDGPDDDGGLYIGEASSHGTIWKLFSKTGDDTYWTGTAGTQGVRFAYKTPLLVDLDPEANNVKKIGDVHVCFHRPSSTQTINLSLYKNGLATAAESVSKSLSATASSSRIWVNWKPQSHAASFQLGITGTVTRPIVIERLKIPSDIFGREQNRQGR